MARTYKLNLRVEKVFHIDMSVLKIALISQCPKQRNDVAVISSLVRIWKICHSLVYPGCSFI